MAYAHQPTPPDISLRDVWTQFQLDVFDKEVQSAATYSYLWIADQVGHIGLGVMLQFLGVWVFQGLFSLIGYHPFGTNLSGLLLIFSATSFWEWRAYEKFVHLASGRFPLNTKGLRKNAMTATLYMWFGAIIGFGFHLDAAAGLTILVATLLLAIIPAPWWIRQKMIWQKASLPYLSRLAGVRKTISQHDADAVRHMMQEVVPPDGTPRQIIIFGDIGSGRTSLASAIGTEFAFSSNKVRYLTLTKFVELAEDFGSYPGPRNIHYWSWANAQVLVLDDVSTALEPCLSGEKPVDQVDLFRRIMNCSKGKGWACLKNRHTVWVVGDIRVDPERWIEAISEICSSQAPPVVVYLAEEDE